MREGFVRVLPVLSVVLLLIWVVSVAGTTGWGPAVNWTLALVAVALLGVRAALA